MAEEKLDPQEEVVKSYLDSLSERDECLKALYVPSKIKACFQYCKKQAKDMAVNGCAMVEDAQVFKWARDYYIEVLPKEADKQTVETVQERAKVLTMPVAKQKKAEVEQQLSLGL